MTWFLVGALVLQVALAPCAWVCWRGETEARLVGLALVGIVQSLSLLCLAEGFDEPALAALAVVLAALTAGASLVFARFLERWV